MPLDRDTAKRCNFFLQAPDWVMREEVARTTVHHIASIPDDNAVYWVGGEVLLRGGAKVAAVFVTSGNGELHAAYWRCKGQWYEQHDPELPAVLGRADIFPYDWRLNVPVERDAFHGARERT